MKNYLNYNNNLLKDKENLILMKIGNNILICEIYIIQNKLGDNIYSYLFFLGILDLVL